MNSTDSVPEAPGAQNGGSENGRNAESTALTVARGALAAATGSPAAAASNAGVVGWLHAFRSRWILALGLSLLGGATGGVLAWATWRPEYTTAATLTIASQQPAMLSDGKGGVDRSSFDVYK